MNIVAEKWDEIIHKLKIEYGLSNVSFRTWIEPLEVYNVSDSLYSCAFKVKCGLY